MWGPYCCVVLWWRFQLVGAGLGGGGFDPSLAVRWLAPTTHSISFLDSSLGRVPACDAGDPGSIPGRGKLNACPLPGGQLTSTHYSQYKSVLRIEDPVPFWPLDPGSGIGFFRILDPNPIFLRTYWQFWLKSSIILRKLNFFLQQFKTEIICNFVKFVAT